MSKKLAIFGGQKVRKNPMPNRVAFGNSEVKNLNKAIKFYRGKNQDPPYSGIFEKKLCDKFSNYMGGGYTVAVATGTGAIYVAMKALNLPSNSDIIISPVTCSGNFSCITEQGHYPILVDADFNSYNTSLEKIKEKLTKKTKLIQITHVGGEPVKDIDAIANFAKKRGIYLLEDCSQSIGAKVNGKLVGTFGNISAFSTMYRKNLAANSSSGLIYTRKLSLYKKSLAFADRGKILWNENLDLRDPKYALFPALNWNTDEFSCAIGIANLKRLKKTNQKRIKFVKTLIKFLNKKKVKTCYIQNFHSNYAPFYLPVTYKSEILKINKKKFTDALSSEGIPLGAHYGCIVNDWKWAKKYFKKNFKTKNAIEYRNNCFHLYLNENYKIKEAKNIVDAILKVENYYLRK